MICESVHALWLNPQPSMSYLIAVVVACTLARIVKAVAVCVVV